MPTSQTSPRRALFEMIQGYVKPQLVYVAAKLGLADLLQDGPRDAAYLAERVEAEPQALQRLLRGLVNIGLVYNTAQGQFELTETGRWLVSDAPGSLHQVAILQGEELFRAWGDLLYSVQTGKPAFEYCLGQAFFNYFSQHPDAGQRFNYFMSNTGGLAARALVEAYNWQDYRQVVDVGGGNGLLVKTLTAAYPHLQATLYDLTADPVVSLGERCQVRRGDFFQGIPAGGDVYLLSQIIHDWDDESARLILGNCRRAMKKNGRLLLFEQVMPDTPGAANPTVELDLVMLVLTGGRERTAAEFKKLLAEAGFKLTSIIATRHDRSLIEAVPAQGNTFGEYH